MQEVQITFKYFLLNEADCVCVSKLASYARGTIIIIIIQSNAERVWNLICFHLWL